MIADLNLRVYQGSWPTISFISQLSFTMHGITNFGIVQWTINFFQNSTIIPQQGDLKNMKAPKP